jgi:hypothetical protein
MPWPHSGFIPYSIRELNKTYSIKLENQRVEKERKMNVKWQDKTDN